MQQRMRQYATPWLLSTPANLETYPIYFTDVAPLLQSPDKRVELQWVDRIYGMVEHLQNIQLPGQSDDSGNEGRKEGDEADEGESRPPPHFLPDRISRHMRILVGLALFSLFPA